MDVGTKFVIEGFEVEIPAGEGVTEKGISFPYDVALIKGVYFDLQENKDDILNVVISPDTVVGQTIVPSKESTTTIYVSESVLHYLHVGYYVAIADGNNYQELGKCLAINKNAFTIQVENVILNDYTTGAGILMTVPLVRDVAFSGVNFPIPIKGTDATSALEKNTVILIKYENKENVSKKFKFNLEVLF